MSNSASACHIELQDFMIRSSPPLPKLLRHSSKLALKLSVNGVGKDVLSTRGDTEHGTWEVEGDVEICEDQLLIATILVYVEDSEKELGTMTASYSQLLAHAEAQPKDCYEFTVDGSTSSALIRVTCSVKTSVLLPQMQRLSSSGKSKSDKGHIDSNRTLKPDASSTPSVADLERYYGQTANIPAERKSQALNNIGCVYWRLYIITDEMEHLERAISILGEALQNASSHPRLPEYLNDLVTCLFMRFECTGTQDDINHAVSKSQEAVHSAETSDPNRHLYILNHARALLERFECLGKLEDLQDGISFMNTAVELVPDGDPEKPGYLNNLGGALQRRFIRLGHVDDLDIAITHKEKGVDLMPDDHLHKPACLDNLGLIFQTRFDRLGHIEDLEAAIVNIQKAVGLTLNGHSDKPKFLNNLGIAFQARFGQLGLVKDLETAIVHKQKAVDLTPKGHPDKPGFLSNLGNSFESRFYLLGRLEDLETAIAHMQKAVGLMPDGHPDKPKCLNNLGCARQRRFGRLGHVEDMEIAIVHMERAVSLTPNGHSDKPKYFNALGCAFRERFGRLGHVKDLEMAVAYIKKAVDQTPDGDPDKTGRLVNLGDAFKTRFDQLGRLEDLETAIANIQKAVDQTPDGHPNKPGRLTSLGEAFKIRFEQSNCLKDLETAIAHIQKAIYLTADGHSERSPYYAMLGEAFIARFILLKRPKDASMALIQFSTAASLPTASPRDRLISAVYWISASKLLERFGVSISSPLEPYHVAIDLLPRVAWLGIPIPAQHTLLENVGGTVREAVSAAIKMEEYETAVEWAEAGRSIAWQNLLNLRTAVREIRSAHYDLANRLEIISQQLNMSVKGGNVRMNDATNGTEEVSRSRVELALDWDNTVADIRSKPGFESFLKPKSFTQLGRIVRDGPVVILNITNLDRCDALILIPEGNDGIYVSSVFLPAFSYAKSMTLLKELKQLLRSRNLRERDARPMKRKPHGSKGGSNITNILRSLWIDVVKPIIEALAYQPQSMDLPRLWWCVTGALAFLPIHASGIYDTDEPGNKLSDYVVSSYTPTLSALLDDSPLSQEEFTLLAIAQANAPGAPSIPKTEVEVKEIQALAKNINVMTMTKEDATVENVWREMENSNWVHLACHGHQDIKEPMKSGLLLHDGTLELQRLIEKPLPFADFAFLSACQTATGDENVAEESLHLAAGMLFAGYKGVIATMWSIKDDIGPRVAEDVYREMLKNGKPNRKAAAHALHEAVRRLREDPKVDMLHWVPFIHIGR